MARLRQEIHETLGYQNAPTYADLKSMKYLQAVMNEAMRLYPAVPFNSRAALHDTTLPRGGGADGMQPVGIPRDTRIAYSTLSMQRREDLYPASPELKPAHEFSPERWASWNPKAWQFIPFNGGPRICIGQQFALTEMAYTIVRILQRFDRVEYRSPEPFIPIKAEIISQPAFPVQLAFFSA